MHLRSVLKNSDSFKMQLSQTALLPRNALWTERFQRADPVLHFFPVLGAQDKPSNGVITYRETEIRGDESGAERLNSPSCLTDLRLTMRFSSSTLQDEARDKPPTPRLLLVSSLTATSTPQVFSSRLVSDAWARFRLTGGEPEKMLKACFITGAASMRVNPCAFNIAIIYW